MKRTWWIRCCSAPSSISEQSLCCLSHVPELPLHVNRETWDSHTFNVQQTWKWAVVLVQGPFWQGSQAPGQSPPFLWALPLLLPVCYMSALLLLLSYFLELLLPLLEENAASPPVLVSHLFLQCSSLRSSEPARTFSGSWIAQVRQVSPLLGPEGCELWQQYIWSVTELLLCLEVTLVRPWQQLPGAGVTS